MRVALSFALCLRSIWQKRFRVLVKVVAQRCAKGIPPKASHKQRGRLAATITRDSYIKYTMDYCTMNTISDERRGINMLTK